MIVNRISTWVAARLTCGLMLTTALTVAMAQDSYPPGYNRTRVMNQRAAMERAGMMSRQNGFPTANYPSRAAYGANVNRGRAAAAANRMPTTYDPANTQQYEEYDARPATYNQPRSRFVPEGEVRGGYDRSATPVSYNQETEVMAEDSMPVAPIAADQGPVYQQDQYSSAPTYPVEVLEGSYDEGAPGCASCQSCGGGGNQGGICDPNCRSKGCNREKCPCPSDEALSYYRCNFYGHYPTFWRSFPAGFMKYRPEQPDETAHDRYRKAAKGADNTTANTGSNRDQDLDQQLKDLMNKEQQKPGAPAAPTAPAPNRAAPELLPENVNPPAPNPPAPGPQSQYRIPGRRAPYATMTKSRGGYYQQH